jgi:hypothetical protein
MNHFHKNTDLKENELILCTGLPGHRRITREDCGRRYILARKDKQKFPETDLDIGKISGLETCSTCPEGSINAELCAQKRLHQANRHVPDPWNQKWSDKN